jgi:uncharacterized membrane protein YgdD (TMEM256/DUF423 family)
MAFRIWLFLAGAAALLAVIMAAHGAHTLGGLTTFSAATKAYEIAQTFHMTHALALFGVALAFAATEGRRTAWAGWMLHIAGAAFVLGIVMFSGGIYHQALKGLQGGAPIIPVGGVSFMTGWAALAVSAFGFRRAAP